LTPDPITSRWVFHGYVSSDDIKIIIAIDISYGDGSSKVEQRAKASLGKRWRDAAATVTKVTKIDSILVSSRFRHTRRISNDNIEIAITVQISYCCNVCIIF